jgi:hypothetical protein
MNSRGVICAALLLLAITGCTQAPTLPNTKQAIEGTKTPTPTSTPTSSSSIADPASTYTVTDGDEVQVSWLSPSRNIECGIVLAGLSQHVWGCSIASHTWTAPNANPADICYNAGADCGTGIEALGAGKLTGRGETIFESQLAVDSPAPAPAVQTLAYGHSVTADGVTCLSLESGMTCNNAGSGHGFTLSKSTYATH